MSEPWWPESYYLQPHFSIRPVPVNDLESFTHRRRKYWDAAITRAIQRWEPAGVAFDYWPNGPAYEGSAVSIEVLDVPPGIGAWTAFEYPPCTKPECAFIQVDITTWQNALASRNIGPLTTTITHEFGHVLGFGHGGTGVMGFDALGMIASPQPNDEEIAAARAYWLP